MRMKLPGQRKWSAGTCAGKVDERSYIVKVGDVEYRRNRKQLVSGHEDPLTELADPSEPSLPPVGDPAVTANPQPADHTRVDAENNVPPTGSPRRSGRVHKKPVWHKDYSMEYPREHCKWMISVNIVYRMELCFLVHITPTGRSLSIYLPQL